MKAKFDIGIVIEDGRKIISPYPHAWNKIKDNQCSTTASNVAIRCGKVNGILVVDLDVPKEGEIDGIRYFEDNVCKISELNTLVTRSGRGGYHIYYKYCQKIASSIRLNDVNKLVSIDVLSDGKCVLERRGL